MANVTIDVAAQFKGKPAFDKAGNAVGGLEKSVSKLAKKFTALFAADKIIAFGKASLKAFEEDQKSAAMLANTMKNLGMEFATPVLETYIANLSKTAAVADDVLRPAMQKLLTQTGNYAKSQEILNQAIEVSRGSGVDLATVTQDLANAYIGNTKGLKKYNLGLTAAELKTMKFADIQKKLTTQFKGANAAYLKTYAGKMEILKTAAGEAQETIGKGLVDSLSLLASDGSVQGLADAMQSLADFTYNFSYALGSVVAELKNVKAAAPAWLQSVFSAASNVGPLGGLKQGIKGLQTIAAYGERQHNKTLMNPSVQMFMTDQANQRLNNIAMKKQQELVKKQNDLIKNQTAEQKKQALLKKQSALFDLEQIELIAALKGKLSDEDRKRAELQLALLQGDEAAAAKLSTELANSIDKTGNLAKYLQTLPDAANPFKNWQSYLDAIEAQVARIANSGSLSTYPGGGAADGAGYAGTYDFYSNPATGGSVMDNYQPSVIVQFQGADSLSQALRDSFVSASMEGSFSQINRTVGAFDR